MPVKAAGIGQDEKARPRRQNGFLQVWDGPCGHHRQPMDRLGPGGIVIEDHNLSAGRPNPGLNTGKQVSGPFGRQARDTVLFM